MDNSICYVGSTCKEKLCQRMSHHRSQYKRCNEGMASFILFDKFGVDNCIIELIELFPCNSKDEITKKEGEYIKQLNCVNKRVEGRTKDQYYQDNKEDILEYRKQYKNNNPEKIKKQCKLYYENNKDQILEKSKIYGRNFKDEISYRKSVPFVCGCGSTIRTGEKARHIKTMKHKTNLELII